MTGPIHGAWIWYELLTTDAVAAKAFYEGVLGWSIAPGSLPPIHYGHIARADGREIGGVLPLTAEMIAQGARPSWIGYIGVEDLDATLAALTARGGAVVMPRMDIDEGSFALVTDPHGAPFYLMAPRPIGQDGPSVAFSPTAIGSCGWNELHAGNVAADLAFYRELFGWDLAELGTYQVLTRDDVPFGGIMARAPQTLVPGWAFYFRVADIDAALAALAPHGGTLLRGPTSVPGEDWVITARDPLGAVFSLVGQRAA